MIPVNRELVDDLAKFAVTTGLGAAAAVVPRGARELLAAALVAVGRRTRRGQLDAAADLLDRWLPDTTLEERRDIAVDMRSTRIEQTLCRGFGIFRQGWPANVGVTGIEHLRRAHDEGRGVVVWVMSFLDSTPFNLVAASEGFPVTHLSDSRHGISHEGVISRRVVAPIVMRAEVRSLKRRVIISPTGGLGYLRELQRILEEEKGTVSIRGDYTVGRRMIEVPMLGGTMAFPTGAPSLAHRTTAPLLTAATVRLGLLDHLVIIDQPIQVRRDLDRRSFQQEAVRAFAERLGERVRTHPGSRPWLPFMTSAP